MQGYSNINKKISNPLFIGTVEDNNDPTFNYRVKVRINELHPSSITTEQLPWAARVDTAFMGMSDSADLSHKIPEVGSKVLILVVGDDFNSLLYLGCIYKKTNQTPSGESYLNTYGVYRTDGQFIGIDKVQKLFQMLFNGDINIDKVKNINANVATNITIKCTNISVECTNANVKANSTKIDCPSNEITGNLKVGGNVMADGEVSAKSGSVNLSSHTHQYVQPLHAAGNSNTTPGQG